MHKGEVSVEVLLDRINIRGGRHRRAILKCDGCLQSLPVCQNEPTDSPALRLLYENGEKDVDLHKHMIR